MRTTLIVAAGGAVLLAALGLTALQQRAHDREERARIALENARKYVGICHLLADYEPHLWGTAEVREFAAIDAKYHNYPDFPPCGIRPVILDEAKKRAAAK